MGTFYYIRDKHTNRLLTLGKLRCDECNASQYQMIADILRWLGVQGRAGLALMNDNAIYEDRTLWDGGKWLAEKDDIDDDVWLEPGGKP